MFNYQSDDTFLIPIVKPNAQESAIIDPKNYKPALSIPGNYGYTTHKPRTK